MVKRVSIWFYNIVLMFFALMTCLPVIIGIYERQWKILIVSFSLLLICSLILKRYKFRMVEIEKTKVLTILVILCFITKFFVAFSYNATPVADYKTYFIFADELSKQIKVTTNPLYIALYPHVFGYSDMLSWIFRITGTNVNTVVILNVCFSTLSMLLIYHICEQINGRRMALISSVLWIIFPSQCLWNMFVLSEPLYTMLLLGVFDALIYWNTLTSNKNDTWKGICVLAFSGAFLLVLFNALRPVGLIIIIAVICTTVFVNIDLLDRGKVIFLVIFISLYFIGNSFVSEYLEFRIDNSAASFSWYNVAVGLNEETEGTWNEADFNRLLKNVNMYTENGSKTPAADAQEAEKKIVVERIQNINHIGELCFNKISILLGNDHTVVEHMAASEISLEERNYILLSGICDVYYYFIAIGGFIGTLVLVWNRNRFAMILIGLYSLGLTMGHILVEVQGRYHYSILIGFLFLCSYGLSYDYRKQRENRNIYKHFITNDK